MQNFFFLSRPINRCQRLPPQYVVPEFQPQQYYMPIHPAYANYANNIGPYQQFCYQHPLQQHSYRPGYQQLRYQQIPLQRPPQPPILSQRPPETSLIEDDNTPDEPIKNTLPTPTPVPPSPPKVVFKIKERKWLPPTRSQALDTALNPKKLPRVLMAEGKMEEMLQRDKHYQDSKRELAIAQERAIKREEDEKRRKKEEAKAEVAAKRKANIEAKSAAKKSTKRKVSVAVHENAVASPSPKKSKVDTEDMGSDVLSQQTTEKALPTLSDVEEVDYEKLLEEALTEEDTLIGQVYDEYDLKKELEEALTAEMAVEVEEREAQEDADSDWSEEE